VSKSQLLVTSIYRVILQIGQLYLLSQHACHLTLVSDHGSETYQYQHLLTPSTVDGREADCLGNIATESLVLRSAKSTFG